MMPPAAHSPSLFALTLHALLPLFLLIVLGYGLKRLRVLHVAQVPILNGLVLNVTLPALIFKGLATAPHLSPQMALPPLAALGAEAGTLALAYAVGAALRLPRPTRGALLLVGAFGNTGFLGYPLVLALLPREFPTAILIDQFGMTIALYLGAVVVGAVFGASGTNAVEMAKAIGRFGRSPLFLSLVAGSIARLVPWPHALTHVPLASALGETIMTCLGYLGQGTTPIVLLALGVALRPGAARAYAVPIGAACVLKLLACPLLMWLLCRGLGLRGDVLTVSVLQSALPTAVMASVLCAEHDLSGDYAVGAVFVSTIVSALTVPLLLSVLR